MSDRFVVEADRKIAGVAVRVPGGFRFFHSDPEYAPLDGRTFSRVRVIAEQVAQLRKRERPQGPRVFGRRPY